jgi:hypothetical protein
MTFLDKIPDNVYKIIPSVITPIVLAVKNVLKVIRYLKIDAIYVMIDVRHVGYLMMINSANLAMMAFI